MTYHVMTSTLTVPAQIEALLLYKGGTVRVKEIAHTLDIPLNDVESGLSDLSNQLVGRGVSLVREGDRVALATAGGAHALIESMRRDELDGPVGKAGLETLAIIVYRGPVSRADIEYIRGVNATAILRSLLIRGLIERVDNPEDKRSFLYRATAELPAYLGVDTLSDLAEYATLKGELASLVQPSVLDSEPQ